MNIQEAEKGAIAALETDAGCDNPRAKKLVAVVKKAAELESLEVVAGAAQSFGSALDRRVATLDRIITALDKGDSLPTEYEVGVIFRVTPVQGRNVLRTYQARFSESYRAHLEGTLKSIKPKRKLEGSTNTKVFVYEFEDPALLEYAAEKLRRRGLTRSVNVDRIDLKLTVDRDKKDRHGKNAEQALKS